MKEVKEYTEQWERENAENIIGWEANFGSGTTLENYVPYDGFKIVIFKMKDKSKVEFKIKCSCDEIGST